MMKKWLSLLLFSAPILLSAQIIDSTSINTVDSLIELSNEFLNNADFEMSLNLVDEAEKITLEQLGTESVSYTRVCATRGGIFLKLGQYQDSEKWYLKGIALMNKTMPKTNPAYAGALISLSAVYQYTGRYEESGELLMEAKDIFENIIGDTDHPFYLRCLNNLSRVYEAQGLMDQAESNLFRVNELMKKKLGQYHPYYIGSIVNIGGFYINTFKYEEALKYLLEAARLFEDEQANPIHPNYVNCLLNLYYAYEYLGQLKQAEPYLLRSMEILEEAVGTEHPRYAIGLISLVEYYLKIGKYTECESLITQAQNIMINTIGVESQDFAKLESTYGHYYVDTKEYDLAIPKFLNAKHIIETHYDKKNEYYTTILNNLAVAYCYVENYQAAADLYLEAIELNIAKFGDNYIETYKLLNNLALLYKYIPNVPLAEATVRKARAMYKIIQNDSEAEDDGILKNMIQILEDEKHYEEIDIISVKSLQLRQEKYLNAATFLSESELTNYINSFGNYYASPTHTLLKRNPKIPHSTTLSGLTYDDLLFKKGFVLMSAQKVNASIAAELKNDSLYSAYQLTKRQLGDEYTQQKIDPDDYALLKDKNNKLEKEILRKLSLNYADLKSVDWFDVKDALKPHEAAIEFDHVWIDSAITYVALLLRHGSQSPEFIPLFRESDLSSLIYTHSERKADYVNELYAWADRGIVQLGSAKKSLYDLIWSKIEAAGLEGITTVYYSPSGVLHRLNLGAIAMDDETILSDHYNLVALNSTRQLVIPSTLSTQANDAILVGGVNFEVDSILSLVESEPLLASRSAADSWTESGTRGGTWSYLKWTEKEAERIDITLSTGGFNTLNYSDSEASEENIKTIGVNSSSPRVLHMATHGFFFPDPEVKNEGLGLEGEEPVFKSSDNPMIRSGLILAGGNYAWQHGRAASPDKEDGILTAYEISQLNLSNTELVVLSACETGLGDINGNEGVYGLQRAFKIAGAKYLIMSLWQVPDRETMEFMTTFYRNWLEENMTIPDAFRKTQREMRDRFYNPYSWAGFVLVE